ncbi:DUF2857 domain-containing protein, partial [Pseudomonas aeruginosa]|nr:DUF2857 domain-containing protein [Pseudomonas aeruginosa]MCS8193659.1 DUF2857 domain-containing protein [Pseudomonas aeruginosa]
GNKISNPPWVKFQSAGWVNFPSAPTDSTMLELTMDLAEALALPMSVIWAAIASWIDQGLV